MAINFKKISATHVVETPDRKFLTQDEDALLAAAIVLGGDIVTHNGIQTLTNKVLDTALNTVTNIDTTMFKNNTIDSDVTLASNSDVVIATQKAVKAYIDNVASVTTGALVFKGAFDASIGTFPSDAAKGWYYKVTQTGTIDGITFNKGDSIFAQIDGASTTTFLDNWFIVDNTDAAILWEDITNVTTTVAQIEFLKNITSDVQNQLNLKLNLDQLDTDAELLANSDTKIPSQKAIKTYVDTAIENFKVLTSTKASGALVVTSGAATLIEKAQLISSIYVENEGSLYSGFTHVANTDTITFTDGTLDTKTIFVTYTI